MNIVPRMSVNFNKIVRTEKKVFLYSKWSFSSGTKPSITVLWRQHCRSVGWRNFKHTLQAGVCQIDSTSMCISAKTTQMDAWKACCRQHRKLFYKLCQQSSWTLTINSLNLIRILNSGAKRYIKVNLTQNFFFCSNKSPNTNDCQTQRLTYQLWLSKKNGSGWQ